MATSIIVLSAGASARMGRPKSLLDFDGRTALSLVLESCGRSQADETVLVLGPAGGAGQERQEAGRAGAWRRAPGGAAAHQEIRIVVNDRPERGRTSSFKAGLEAISPHSDGFVLFPVDMPLVRSEDIDALIARQAEGHRGRTIFVASYEGVRGHPVLFSRSHREPILALPDDQPLRDYVRVKQGETESVDLDNEGVVAEMNTPEQYRRIATLYQARRAATGGSGGAAV